MYMDKTRFKAGKAPRSRIAKGKFIPKPIERLDGQHGDFKPYPLDEIELVRIGTGIYQVHVDNKNKGWFKYEIDAPP